MKEKRALQTQRIRNPRYKRGLVEESDPLVKTNGLSGQALDRARAQNRRVQANNVKSNMKKIILLLNFIYSINVSAQLIDYSPIDTNIQAIYEWRVSYEDSGRIDTSLETILFYDSTGYLTEKRWNFRSHMKGDYTSMKHERMNLGSQEIITFSNPPPLFDGQRVDLVTQSCDHFDSNSRLIKVEKTIKPDIHQLTTFSYEKSGLLKEVIVIENNKVRFKYFVEYKYR